MARNFGGIELGVPNQGAGNPATPPAVPGSGGSAAVGSAAANPGVAGGGQEDLVPGEIIVDVTEATFEETMLISTKVPVVIDLWAPWCGPCKQLGPILEKVVSAQGGRVQLAKVNVDENPGIAQAFGVQGIPAVFALVGGRPMPLFTGAVPEAQVRQVVEKLLDAAAQMGLRGRLGGGVPAPAEPADPLLEEAEAALEAGDFAAAKAAYEHYLKKNPGESSQIAPALAQVELAERLAGGQVGAAANTDTGDVAGQLAAADQQVQAGDYAGALERLLAVMAQAEGEDKDQVRQRLVDYFNLIGVHDPLVVSARKRLATLLY